MSEMLGNQYFMARNYSAAEAEFEECLDKYPLEKSIRKKLIICYTQSNKLERALDMFLKLIKEDINFIVKTDFVEDDCPCPELINKIEDSNNYEPGTRNYYLMLGIIWLYCNIEKSLENFQKALKIDESDSSLNSIIFLIKEHFKKISAVS